MPRQLFALSEWRLLKLDIEEAQCGDILFVRNKMHPKLLSHAALVIEVNKIFHCYPQLGTAVIQSQEEFFDAYEQKLDFKRMISYIDPRNRELREAYEGNFISDF